MKQPESAAFASLLNVLNELYPLSPEAQRYLRDHVTPCIVTKRKLLLKEGMTCEHIYFIIKGALRGFTREGSKDITTWIVVENELVSSILSLDERVKSLENIQALEKCELLSLTLAELGIMYERFPESNILARKILQRYYADAEQRAFIARLTKAENKYRYFLKRHQALANRIPLKYIASYLGVTLETLSRIRKKFTSRA
ncbi:MAG TPA: Crp/Fnr family transcriptional regulator [Puia sp.]|jgi:CRP-like cAMP-binding protein|nr:Crp/Fnr family transcriptional regulator [Puia sp.]